MEILGFNRVELIVHEDEIDAAVKQFNELLGTHLPQPYVVPGQTVKSATDFDGSIEFVSGVNGEGPFAARIAEKGPGQIGPLVWEVDDIDSALPHPLMQTALANVELVRVDIDEFKSELALQKMYEKSVPWFYKIDSTARPTDAISADEWDENIAENMAPILKAFADGTLTKRRNASQIGTPL